MDDVRVQLRRRFQNCAAPVIDAAIADAEAFFADARLLAFVSLLVERRVVAHLRSLQSA